MRQEAEAKLIQATPEKLPLTRRQSPKMLQGSELSKVRKDKHAKVTQITNLKDAQINSNSQLVTKPSRQNTTMATIATRQITTFPQHATRPLDPCPDLPTSTRNFSTRLRNLLDHHDRLGNKLQTKITPRQIKSCIKNVFGSPVQKLQTATNKGPT